MVTERQFDLTREPLRGAVDDLNDELASLKLATPPQSEEQKIIYGDGVFGVVFNGATKLGAAVNAVASYQWPEDTDAVSLETAAERDHLVIAANYPDDKTEALHYFTTFNPGVAAWIADEPLGSPLRTLADIAVDIDASAILQASRKRRPRGYKTPMAYAANLSWLVVDREFSTAVIEVNKDMEESLEQRAGLELSEIPEAVSRIIDGGEYKRYEINPATPQNELLVSVVRAIPPMIYRVRSDGTTSLAEMSSVAA